MTLGVRTTIAGVHKGTESGQSTSTAQLLGKCDRLQDELSRADDANPRHSGYIRCLADEISALERAIAATRCRVSARPSARSAALLDEAVDRMFVAPHRASGDALAPAISGRPVGGPAVVVGGLAPAASVAREQTHAGSGSP